MSESEQSCNLSISPHSKYPLSITNTTVSFSGLLAIDGDGVTVGVILGVTDIGVTSTPKPKSSHVKSDGVTEGVEVIDGVGDTEAKLLDGVGETEVDGVNDGLTLIEGVTDGVVELDGVGVGVTVHDGSEQVVVAELTKNPIIVSVALPLTPVKQFSG